MGCKHFMSGATLREFDLSPLTGDVDLDKQPEHVIPWCKIEHMKEGYFETYCNTDNYKKCPNFKE